MEISRAIEILKNKNDYIVPNSDMDEAIAVAISVMEQEIEIKVREKPTKEEFIKWFNKSIRSDEIIDEFLRKIEEK